MTPLADRTRPRAAHRWLAGVALAALVATLAHGAVARASRATAGVDPSAHASVAAAPAAVVGVGPIVIVVADLERAVDFYGRVLGFTQVADAEVAGEAWERLEGVFGLRMRIARLRLGDESLELREFAAPRGRPLPHDGRANDHDFQHVAIVVRDMARAYAWLRANDVEHASTGPQRLPGWNPAAAGIEAFYFRDPDGHFLELLAFPDDKGDARWHRPGDDLFLGIDHTAIVVGDTDRALRLYRDTLGLRIAGVSRNSGTEQEHLNNVAGARLRITTLRAGAGPGIELLEYLAPRDGRPAPADARANDLASWQTRLTVADPVTAAAALRAARVRFVSPGVVPLPDDALGFTRALVVRDQDGHALEITGAR